MPKSTAVAENSQPSSAGGFGRLPVHLTSFIGRKDELSALQALLEQQEVRLLTLTGPGGSGKSRLATRLAAEVGDNYEDGLCWVELADLADASLIVQNIVMALDVGDPTTSPSTELLIQTLRRRQLLLVLDNCEHLLDECARLVTQLLKNVPDLYILATSRERLNIPGEMTWAVNGLSVPDSFDFENTDDPVAQLLTYDAVSLFVARARLVLPSFEVDASLAPFIWKVCVQLDGIPLALELAAARLRTLGVAQIAERVSDHLDLLAAKSDLLPARQQTMRATLEWSHELLTEPEQELFRALAVFRGSFSLEAAKAIAAVMITRDGDQWSASAPGDPTADLLESLVDRSLVVVEARGSQRTTYRLLETIRVFATEKSASSGQLELAKDTHLGFYHRLTQTAVPKLRGPEQQRWVARLEQEYDNLRAALTWVIEQAQTASQKQADYSRLALEMAGNLFWFWNAANYFTEGYNWSQSVLALPGQEKLIAERARTLYTAGTQAWLTGDFATARVHLDESLLLSQQQEDELGIANVWMMLGRIHLYQGRAKQASRFAADSVGLFRELGAEHELGLALGLQSAAAAMQGNYDPARTYAEEMLAIFQAIGDPLYSALAYIDLGWAVYHQGDLMAAVDNLEQGLAMSRQVDSRWLIAQSLNYLSEIARYQGRYKIAADYIEECLALAEEVGARAWLAQGTRNLAYVSLYANRPQEAAGLFLQSLDHVRHLGDQAGIALALQGLVAVAAGERAWSLALALNEEVATLREHSGPPRTPAERDDVTRLAALMSEMPGAAQSAAGVEAAASQAEDIFVLARQVAALFRPRLIQVEPVSYDLTIYTLGPTQVLRDGQPLTSADWNYAKPKELLFYLVAHEARTKAQIGLDFWPDASPTQLRRNFRAALYRLRQALGGREWIVYEGGRYAFNRQLSYWYDVEAFEERIAVASQAESNQPDQAIAEFTRAIRLYRGDFLEDVALDEWASPRREALQQTFLQACLKRAGILVDKGDLDPAVDAYQQILVHDNLSERAHRGLMLAYARQGNRNQALRHYEDLRQLLADELGAEPAAETQTLYQQIKTNQAV